MCLKLLRDNDNNYELIEDEYDVKRNLFIWDHLKELGYQRETTLTRRKIKDVVKAFNTYSTFEVDIEKLINYIKINEPIPQNYIDFINYEMEKTGNFPRKKIELDKKDKNSKHYSDSWYNALHLQTAKAYPIYLELLEKNNLIDFANIQRKALDYLKENPKTKYRHILVDEFQDTDPLQCQIFEILMIHAFKDMNPNLNNNINNNKEDNPNTNNAINNNKEDNNPNLNNVLNNKEDNNENNEINASFTAVGDIDQSIYGFRGALENYFKYFYEKYDVERVSLNTNYRSTDEIIKFSERFISKQREEYSIKQLTCGREDSYKIHYLNSENYEIEAENLVKIIKQLKEENIIEDYNDIAILFRSLNHSIKLTETLIENKIPFQINGLKDLLNKNEIKSILTLLHFIVYNPKLPIFTSWELDWLNLTAFSNTKFVNKMANISKETNDILIEVWETFQSDALTIAKEVYFEMYGSKCRKRSFKGILDLEDEVLDKVFKIIKKPSLTNENLIAYGITNQDDLDFFKRLNKIKEEILNQDNKFNHHSNNSPKDKDKITILDTYYKLLELGNYLSEDFINDEKNKDAINNIALFTQIIYLYENIESNTDIHGLYWFLNANVHNYYTDISNKNGINLMSVHKSKGLEFPVVILISISEDRFPKYYKDLSVIKYNSGNAVFYTPKECLSIKNDKDEVISYNDEEERIMYVAMTRAEDILILSKVDSNQRTKKKYKFLESLNNTVSKLKPNSDKLSKDELEVLELTEDTIEEIITHENLLNDVISNSPDLINKIDNIDEFKFKPRPQNKHSTQVKNNDETYDNKINNDNKNNYYNENTKSKIETDTSQNRIEADDSQNDKITLSYSSIETYEKCPLYYNLNYNYNFKISDNIYITYGNISHNSLEELNNLILTNKKQYYESNDIDEEDILSQVSIKRTKNTISENKNTLSKNENTLSENENTLSKNENTISENENTLSENENTISKDICNNLKNNELFISKDEIKEIVKNRYKSTKNVVDSAEDLDRVISDVFKYWNNFGKELEVLESEYPFEIKKDNHTLKGAIDLIYKTDNGIAILDYKTTDNVYEDKLKKYTKQLYTYRLALKQDPKYKDIPVEKLQIYAIKSGELIDIEIDNKKLKQRDEDIQNIADNILNKEFKGIEFNEDIKPCKYCKFKFVCKNR